MLAGISVEYYVRLERGNAQGVSEDVLEGVVRALQLDEAERAHLFDLVRTATAARPQRRRAAQERVRPTVQRILDAMTDVPAYVRNGRLDILASNQLGAALYSEVLSDPVRPANTARFLFLNPRASEFFVDWDTIADDAVAILRAEAGRDPHDRRLSRPDRGAVHPQRGISDPVGIAQRQVPPHRRQTPPPPRRRRPDARLRGVRVGGRFRAANERLHRGARLALT